MRLNTILTALGALALCSALPVVAQTSMTIEAESMTLSSYAIENGNRIKLTASSGSASRSFSGASGTYRIQVYVQPETDGQSTLEVYRGSTRLRAYTYPLSNTATSFTIDNVALNSGETIRLVGRKQGGAHARVDRMVLTQVAAATTTTPTTTTTTPATTTSGSPVTMQAEGMTRSNYAVEGSLIKVVSSSTPGTAAQSFSGASGTYNMQVYVQLENDGQPTLEVYRGSTLLRRYVYPLGTSLTNFAINNVALASAETIRLVGRIRGGAHARVDRLVFVPIAVSTPSTTPTTPTTTPTTPTAPATSAPLTLPSTNTRAIATFESLGLYWTPPSAPGAAGCNVQYRKAGESAWRDGLAMWYDARNSECRGSLVHLSPGTDYQVQFSLPGQQPSAQLAAKTWSENFPIARTVYVTSGSEQINITEGGSASGYVLYTPAPGTQAVVDVANNADYNIAISAPYVIVRGLTLKGAKIDGIRLLPGAKDVVIEDNDISGWGRLSTKVAGDWKVGIDRDSAIGASCASQPKFLERVVIQRNKLHHPRYTANSWDWGHPQGPQAVTFSKCGGNHVLRYNEVYSSDGGNYFNDGFSGGENFSDNGFPDSDTDIYGNKIMHTWDDGIESEGGNRNVRIWGNYIDQTGTGIASTVVHHGPLYIFRNVYNRSRNKSQKSLDSDDRNSFFKAGAAGGYGNGRRYVFHNTALQATRAGLTYPLGAGAGLKGNTTQPLTNTVSRNNIFHVWKSNWESVAQQSGSFGNDANYDLFNGAISSFAGAEANGILGTPIYKAGHGWANWGGGNYQLDSASPGYNRGVRLPNFNDAYTGAGPDMGAHEAGTAPMKFGVSGSSTGLSGGSTGATSDTSGTTSTAGSTDGVCSTAQCVLAQ